MLHQGAGQGEWQARVKVDILAGRVVCTQGRVMNKGPAAMLLTKQFVFMNSNLRIPIFISNQFIPISVSSFQAALQDLLTPFGHHAWTPARDRVQPPKQMIF